MSETLMRPNGKRYRPRKTALAAHAWSNRAAGCGDDEGVLILGTHDVERARKFANEMCEYWFGLGFAVEPVVGWYRDGYRHGERAWVEDADRGRPGIYFTADDRPNQE